MRRLLRDVARAGQHQLEADGIPRVAEVTENTAAQRVRRVARARLQRAAVRLELRALAADPEETREPESTVEPGERPLGDLFSGAGRDRGLEGDRLGPGVVRVQRERLLVAVV